MTKTFDKLKSSSQQAWDAFVSVSKTEYAYEAFTTWLQHWNLVANYVQRSNRWTAAEKQHIFAPLTKEKADAMFARMTA